MNAKEMFEDSGLDYYSSPEYIEVENNGFNIIYWKIGFDLFKKEFVIYGFGKDEFIMDMTLLKAIQKQIEELGWNE
jgi:hypothetical protein